MTKTLLLSACLTTIVSCHAAASASQSTQPTAWLHDGKHTLRVHIATDEYSRAHGLMFTPYLLPYEGMLFVFDPPRPVAFWMKNTIIPLDMRFYDQHGNLLRHYPYATPCISTPCATYPANGMVRYVLEQRGQYRFLPLRRSDNTQLSILSSLQ